MNYVRKEAVDFIQYSDSAPPQSGPPPPTQEQTLSVIFVVCVLSLIFNMFLVLFLIWKWYAQSFCCGIVKEFVTES